MQTISPLIVEEISYGFTVCRYITFIKDETNGLRPNSKEQKKAFETFLVLSHWLTTRKENNEKIRIHSLFERVRSSFHWKHIHFRMCSRDVLFFSLSILVIQCG